MGLGKELIKQIMEPYKETLRIGLIKYAILITSLLTVFFVTKNLGLTSLETYYVISLSIICLIISNSIYEATNKSQSFLDDLKQFSITLTLFLAGFSVLYWSQILWGAAAYFFIVSTLILAGVIMWRRKDFIGRSMALVETEIFGEPQTNKWKKKLKEEQKLKKKQMN